MKNNKNEYLFRNETKLHLAPSYVILLNGLSFLLLMVGIIGLIITFNSDNALSMVFITLIIVCVFYGAFTDIYFEYQNRLRCKLLPNTFVAEYDLNSDLIPSRQNKVTIVCRDLTDINVRGYKIIMKGFIEEKRPLKKPKQLSQYTFPIIDFSDNDREKIITYFNDKKEAIINGTI